MMRGGDNNYPSPDSFPTSSFKRPVPPPGIDPDEGDLLHVAYNPAWTPVLMAACEQLLLPSTWIGDHDQVIAALNGADLLRFLLQEPAGGDETMPTPFWDEDQDVDDELPDDVQPWYGYITDTSAPPGELNFVEKASIWTITGFLALATWEIGFAPAILFHTIAPRFALAMRRGDIGAIIKIYIDGAEAATVDTSPAAPGDVIRVPIVGDPELEDHEIIIVQES